MKAIVVEKADFYNSVLVKNIKSGVLSYVDFSMSKLTKELIVGDIVEFNTNIQYPQKNDPMYEGKYSKNRLYISTKAKLIKSAIE